MKKIAILLLILNLSSLVHAGEFDVEDVSAESDAALADNKSVQENLAKEKAQSESAHKAADQIRQSTEQKTKDAIAEMKRSQNEIQSLTADQIKIKEDIEKMKIEMATANKTLLENKSKVEKAKAELAALQQLRDETNKKLVEIAAETDKTSLELKELDYGTKQATADFQQVKEDAKVSGDKLAKMKEELTQKKAQAALNGAGNQASTAAQQPDASAGATPAVANDALPFGAVAPDSVPVAAAAVPAAPVEVQRSISSEAPSPGEMTLKKDCKVYDRVTKGPQVLGVKYNGTSIVKTDESRYWIGFALSPSQKGFVAKTCF